MVCKPVGLYQNMEVNFLLLLLGFLLLLLAVDFSYGVDSVVKKPSNADIDPKKNDVPNHTITPNETLSGSDSGSDSSKADPVKKDEHPIDESKAGGEKTEEKIKPTEQTDSKEANGKRTGKGSLGGDNRKEKPGDGSESKQASKEGGGNNGASSKVGKKVGGGNNGASSKVGKKESLQGEECDPSNDCSNINNFVACLRVPGNESPDLSLLIQNKGKTPLTVMISAPDFVKLESTKVELQEKDDKKVKVSFGNGGSDNSIVLTAGKDSCTLHFNDPIAKNSQKKTANNPVPIDSNFLTRTSTLAFLSLIVLVAAASACICIRLKHKYSPSSVSKYQKLETELPVSGGGKTEAEVNEGWDDSWGTWDDEEAPKTPSMPLTPSLSSRGLASRRLSKEGWKD